MTRFTKCLLAIMATCTIALASVPARAAYLWDIDQTQSKVSLAFPDKIIQGNNYGLRNQTGSGSNWTIGNSVVLDGVLSTASPPTFAPGPVQFVAGSSIVGLNSGNYRPNPAAFNPLATNTANPDGSYANVSTAPGAFGGKIVLPDIFGATAAYLAFRDTNFGLTSVPMASSPSGPFTSTFNATGLQFGFSNTTLDMDGVSVIIVGQILPDMHETGFTSMGTNTNPNGIYYSTGFTGRLTIPLLVPLAIDIDGKIFNATLTGQIVANYIPEPSALLMGTTGLVSLAVYARRRRRNR